MQYCRIKEFVALALLVLGMQSVWARTFEFRALGSSGAMPSGIRNSWESSSEAVESSQSFQIRIGSALKTDSMAKMEIRAATLMRNVSNKTVGINDIATLTFEPINQGKSIHFMVTTGIAKRKGSGRYSSGWQVSGGIIEIWQNGKMVKHWTNFAGMVGKTRLTRDVELMNINTRGYTHSSTYTEFDNSTRIFPVTAKGEKISLSELLAEFRKDSEGAPGDVVPQKGKVAPEDFTMSKFCGFEFGQRRPEFEPKVVRLSNPFLHFTAAVPKYEKDNGQLVSITLRTRKSFMSQLEREMAASDVAAAFEKDYGVHLKGSSGWFSFENDHVLIRVDYDSVVVQNLDVQNKGLAVNRPRWKVNETSTSQMRYIIRRSDRITVEDRRIVLEDMRSSTSTENNYGNILTRRFNSQQDIDDFMLVNPKAQIFDSLSKLKAFMRTIKFSDDVAGGAQEERQDSRRHSEEAPPREGWGDSQNNMQPSQKRKLTDEELLLIELKHDEEMLKRKIEMKKKGQLP